ncbi:MAG TPA: M20/M25/M40 family metallo-hydrolase [Gemmatimonadaceae bacterium]|nr:M20/M25/M40 family metallo-hydrolase [Gemmatimonadaceae bacterium]
MKSHLLCAALLAGYLLPGPLAAQDTTAHTDSAAPASAAADSTLAADILRELVAIRTISSSPATVEAARALAARLHAAGYSEEEALVTGPHDSAGNLVVRLRGRSSDSPLLLLAHLDVVDALASDWSTDPFKLTEEDGWWYGRGTVDNKTGVAVAVANLIRWKQDGFVPARDIVFIATADEETGSESIRWFMTGDGWRYVGKPVYALNLDVGGGAIVDDREVMLLVQTSEKIYATFILEVSNSGGHSSQPRPDNAIYTLARALGRVEAHRFPVELTEATKLYLERMSEFQPDSAVAAAMQAVALNPADTVAAGVVSRVPVYNASIRTTCVATRLQAGHADNALPQTARATVNCRLIPGNDPGDMPEILSGIIADTSVQVAAIGNQTPSPPSPVDPEIFGVIERLASEFWPGVRVIPSMSTGGTDGLYVRTEGIRVYGADAVFERLGDSRAHGRDERIEIRRFRENVAWWKRLVEELTK